MWPVKGGRISMIENQMSHMRSGRLRKQSKKTSIKGGNKLKKAGRIL